MTGTSVVIELPEGAQMRLQQLAEATDQTLESVVLQTVVRHLPPTVDDLPVDMRKELAGLLSLPDSELGRIASEERPPMELRRHERLLRKSAAGQLSEREMVELGSLRDLADKFMFRRSFVLAILKWRGRPTSTRIL